jgi:hypothetical protein
MNKKFPKSVRKFIRRQKAQIRRIFLDVKKQNEEIDGLYKKLFKTALETAVVAAVKPAKEKTIVKKVKIKK